MHGGYHQLRGGTVHDALVDLTGCPTNVYHLEDESLRKFTQNGHFWTLLEYFKSENYLVAFQSEAHPLWVTQEELIENEKKKLDR